MKSLDSSEENPHQETFIHGQEQIDSRGVRRDYAALMTQNPAFDLWENVANWNLSRSSSDLGEKESREAVSVKSTKKSASDLVLETYARSLSGRMTLGSVESFVFPSIELALGSNLFPKPADDIDKVNDPVNESISSTIPDLEKPTFGYPTRNTQTRRSYTLNKKNVGIPKIPLPHSAASFYNATSVQMEVVEACESADRLNTYLIARKADVKAGVPGRFLHAVIGQDVADVGSVASTIMYAFYLHESLNDSQLCTVPIINMKSTDLNMHAEVKWLLGSCQIDPSSLIFIDEIDLTYYDLFGSLKLVLLNGHKIPTKLEAIKEALVEIFNCKQANSLYPQVDNVTIGQDCSCCTLIAEKFALASPENLAGQGFSRLLLSGILLDTGNLTNAQCTTKDKYMATLLIKGAGRFGCNGLYQILKYKKFDISELKVREILRKDFKKWTRVAGKPDNIGSRMTVSHIGMSSIGISIGQLLAHEVSAAEEVILFQKQEKLRLLMVVSGYYDEQKKFKREILVSADTAEHMRNLLNFFNSNSSQLPLKVLNQPGLKEELRAFEIENKITSRKTIEKLLEEFGGNARRV